MKNIYLVIVLCILACNNISDFNTSKKDWDKFRIPLNYPLELYTASYSGDNSRWHFDIKELNYNRKDSAIFVLNNQLVVDSIYKFKNVFYIKSDLIYKANWRHYIIMLDANSKNISIVENLEKYHKFKSPNQVYKHFIETDSICW